MKAYRFALNLVLLTVTSLTLCVTKEAKPAPDDSKSKHIALGLAKGAAAVTQALLGVAICGLAIRGTHDLATGCNGHVNDKFFARCATAGFFVAPACFYAAWKIFRSSRSSFRKAQSIAKAA